MALFKSLRGKRENLPSTKTDGYAYFCTDDGTFWIDYKDENNVVQRKQINAKDAETLMGASISTILNSSDVEIPTSKAVLDALVGKVPDGGITGQVLKKTETGTEWADVQFKPAGKSYLTFSSPNSFTLKVYDTAKHWDGTLEYFASDRTWTTWDGTTTLSSVDNDGEYVLYLRGTGNTKIGYYDKNKGDYISWVISGADVRCDGNIETLLDYVTVETGQHPMMAEMDCFNSLFRGCTALITSPELPATTLASYCYTQMFQNCINLTQAPALPATTLAFNCYNGMFYGCTSLTKAPALPATTLADHCYASMFMGCTSLTQAPALPAITLAISCYWGMFRGCTSLTQAPSLPATTLARSCYQYMFIGCTALAQAPALPATTLANYCYSSMFENCTSLKLSTTHTSEYTVAYRIPTTGTGTTAQDALSSMFWRTSGTFKGTPSLNTTYYLSSDNMIVRDTEIATLNGYVGAIAAPASHVSDTTVHVTAEEKAAWNAKLDSYTETDPTVPDWAKQPTKPTYTADEVGAAPASHVEDTTIHVTSDEKSAWNESISIVPEAILPNSKGGYYMSICYGNDKFVAMPNNTSYPLYSYDGISWQYGNTLGYPQWGKVVYADGKFVTVCPNSSNLAAYSTDGINWTKTTLPAKSRWNPVAYGNGKFVTVATNSDNAAYSTDGINWTQITLPVVDTWYSMAFGDDKFVVVAVSDSTTSALYSTDGINWTQTALPDGTRWHSIAYGNGKFVAVSHGAILKGSTIAAYSTDGITWTQTTLPTKSAWKSVCYGNNKFVAVSGDSTNAAYSMDGINWVETTLPMSVNWECVTYGDGKFVVIAQNNINVAYSYDGITWFHNPMIINTISKNNVTETTKTILGISDKQDKLTGTAGQMVGFDENGNAVAQTLNIDTGVTSFNGQKGAITFKSFYVGTSAPSDTNVLWIDTTNGLKYYNGTSWVIVPVGYSD